MPERASHWLGDDRPSLTDADAMEALDLDSVRKLRRLIASGRLDVVHTQLGRRYSRNQIRECIRRCTTSNRR